MNKPILDNSKKASALLAAWTILLAEILLMVMHHQWVFDFLIHYVWVLPLLLLKSLMKKLLFSNVFGLLKVLWGLLWHFLKLLFIKLLKTFGVRYGAYFSSHRWRKVAQRLRLINKRLARRQRRLQAFIGTFNKCEYVLILVAFLPLFLLLFLLGVAFRMTREAMVKKSSELGVTKVAFSTVSKRQGLIAWLKSLDAWILRKIETLAK